MNERAQVNKSRRRWRAITRTISELTKVTRKSKMNSFHFTFWHPVKRSTSLSLISLMSQGLDKERFRRKMLNSVILAFSECHSVLMGYSDVDVLHFDAVYCSGHKSRVMNFMRYSPDCWYQATGWHLDGTGEFRLSMKFIELNSIWTFFRNFASKILLFGLFCTISRGRKSIAVTDFCLPVFLGFCNVRRASQSALHSKSKSLQTDFRRLKIRNSILVCALCCARHN